MFLEFTVKSDDSTSLWGITGYEMFWTFKVMGENSLHGLKHPMNRKLGNVYTYRGEF